jgi:hypothetical protein
MRWRYSLRWLFVAMLLGAGAFAWVRSLAPTPTVHFSKEFSVPGGHVYTIQHTDGSWEEYHVRSDGSLRGIEFPATPVPGPMLHTTDWSKLEDFDSEAQPIVTARFQALLEELRRRNVQPELTETSTFRKHVADLPRTWPRLKDELMKHYRNAPP